VAVVIVALVILLVTVGIFLIKMLFGNAGSRGDIAVPNVVNLQMNQAEESIKAAGLVPVVLYRNSESTEKDLVFEQNPKFPRYMRRGAKVVISVSMGKARFTVPVLTGKNVDDAEKELIAAGLMIGEIKKVYDPTLPPGQVVSQDPEAGRQFTSPPDVKLLLADKAQTENGIMPNVIGQDLQSVEQLIARSKLQLSRVTYVVDDSLAPGTVTKQSIVANAPLKIGQRVELEAAMSTADAQQENKTLSVTVTIPDGAVQQQLRIEVQDALGKNESLNEPRAPHDTVNKMIGVQGAAKIVIYLRDMKTPWRTDVIPYVAPAPGDSPDDQTNQPLGGRETPPDDTTPPPGATF
jgi:serine/threonine-protein kinase